MSWPRVILSVFFVASGVSHFLKPKFFEDAVPPWIPGGPAWPVQVSGVAEIAGGGAVLVPAADRWTRRWLAALLLAIYPANVHMAQHRDQYTIPNWWLWARLPLQFALIAWIWHVLRADAGRARGGA